MLRGCSSWLGVLALAASFGLTAGTGQAMGEQQPAGVSSFSGAYLAARAAEADKDLDSAIGFYQRALTLAPNDLSLRQSLMLALISQGRFDESLVHAEKLKTVPEAERFSRLALGIEALRQMDYGGADHWFKLAMESDLDRLVTGLARAWAKVGQDDYDGALAVIDELAGPQWYELFQSYHRALVADRGGLAEVADQAYAQTVDNALAGGAAPEAYLRAVEAYAGYLARAGEPDSAIEVIEKGLEFSSSRIQLLDLKQRIEAGETIHPLIDMPADGAAEVLYGIGSALGRGGGEAFVRLYLQFALALKPQGDVILMQLAAIAEQQQRGEEAVALYRRVPESSPLHRIAELQLGLNLADMDRHDEAIPHLEALVEVQPQDMRSYLALGGVHASREDYRTAAEVYDRAVALLPEPAAQDWNIFYQRGIAYERLREWPKAEPNFRKALELHPDQPQVLNYLGYSWVDMNLNLEEGLDLIRRAVELRPNDGYIVDSLGWAYYRLGRFEDAVSELERAVSLRPNDPILNDHLGDAYWRVGRRLEATFQWTHARDMDPEPDVLAELERKLAGGLPPLEEQKKAAAETAAEPAEELAAAAMEPGGDKASQDQNASTAAVSPRQHTVLPGQSLWSIAAEILGDGNRYRELLELNPQLRGDPGRIVPGQELRVPPNL